MGSLDHLFLKLFREDGGEEPITERYRFDSNSMESELEVAVVPFAIEESHAIAPPSIPFRRAYQKKTQRSVPLTIFPQQCQEVKENPNATATIPYDPLVKIAPGQLTKQCRQILTQGRAGINAVGEILDEAIRQDHRIVTFKGLSPACGCSSLLMGVATCLAGQGFDILVIDAHFDRPKLAHLAGLSPACGWEEIIFHKKMIYEVAYPVILPFELNNLSTGKTVGDVRFLLAPLTEVTASSAVVASCKKEWLTTMATLTEQFDLILIDGGGFSHRSIDETIASMLRFGTDSFFLVEDLRYNGYLPTVELIEQANTFHLPCLGMIANFT